MHTGVSEGNVVTALPYAPCSARKVSAGMRGSPAAASNIDGVRPSMTIRTTLVAGKRTESCKTFGRAAAEARRERGHDRGFEVTDSRNPRERRKHNRRDAQHECSPEARPA